MSQIHATRRSKGARSPVVQSLCTKTEHVLLRIAKGARETAGVVLVSDITLIATWHICDACLHREDARL